MKYFLYELKRSLLPVAIFTLISVTVFVINSVTEILGSVEYSLLNVPAITLSLLCIVVPVLTYSFRNDPRCADMVYALPMNRKRLYLTKTLVGLVKVFVPYIISYIVGVLILVFNAVGLMAIYYSLFFFLSLIAGLMMFGINSFAFTRANNTADGILFMMMYSVALPVLALDVLMSLPAPSSRYFPWLFWSVYSIITELAIVFDDLVVNSVVPSVEYLYSMLPVMITYFVLSIAAWTGMFLTVGRGGSEKAGHISDSPFGYRSLLPYYTALLIALMVMIKIHAAFYVFVCAAGILGYALFRRTFRIRLVDMICLLASIAAGTLWGVIVLMT